MGKIRLESHGIVAEFKSLGAELTSLRKGGVEYLWQGDPAFWNGQSPLLFPNTGRYWDNRYHYDGQTFEQKAHGFARTSEFAVIDRADNRVVFGLHSSDETLKVYPFSFFLFVTYRLDADGLTVEWFVRNEGDTDMYFQIGAHPALNLPDYDAAQHVHGYLQLEPAQRLQWFIPEQKGCIDPAVPQTLDGAELMPLTAQTFNVDTYVIEASGLRSCTLLTADKQPWVSVDFNMPVLALWAPTINHPDCPFVCIEPWYGSCDTIGYDGPLAERRHEQTLAPGSHFLTSYRIRLH